MWLASSRDSDGVRIQCSAGARSVQIECGCPQQIARQAALAACGRHGGERVIVGGHFRQQQGMAQFPADLALDETGTPMNGDPGLQIGKLEGRLPVSPIHRSQNCKQRLVLVDRQGLAIAKRPTLWGEIECEDPYLADKRCCHDQPEIRAGDVPFFRCTN